MTRPRALHHQRIAHQGHKTADLSLLFFLQYPIERQIAEQILIIRSSSKTGTKKPAQINLNKKEKSEQGTILLFTAEKGESNATTDPIKT